MSNGEELSERELEILRLVATGVSNKEIAQVLSISPNTVKVHMRNIFAKIAVASRTEATLYALKTGLISSPAAPVDVRATELDEALTPALPENTLPAAPAAEKRLRWWRLAALIVLAALTITSALRLSAGLPLIGQAPTPTPTPTPIQFNIQRWKERASMPQALRSPAVVIFERSAYVIGGSNADGASSAVFQYDLAQDAWTARSAKPTAVDLAGAVLIGETVYIPGGRGANGQATAQLEIYLPRADEWQTRASLPQALYAYGLAAYEGKIYLFGGWDGKNYLDSVFIYDPQSDTWASGPSMPYPAAYLAAATASGKIFIMGGLNDDGILDNNTAFYPQRVLNAEPAWEVRSPLLEPRQAFGAAYLADAIYLVGGLGETEREPAAVIYDTLENRWMSMEPRTSAPHSPANGAFLTAVPWQTAIHIFGGEFSGQLSDQHASYQAIYTVTLPVLQNNGSE